MITAIINGHVLETPAREMGPAEREYVIRALAEQGIYVIDAVDIYHHVHLYALGPTTTRQEVRAIAAWRARTDARLVWHGAVAW